MSTRANSFPLRRTIKSNRISRKWKRRAKQTALVDGFALDDSPCRLNTHAIVCIASYWLPWVPRSPAEIKRWHHTHLPRPNQHSPKALVSKDNAAVKKWSFWSPLEKAPRQRGQRPASTAQPRPVGSLTWGVEQSPGDGRVRPPGRQAAERHVAALVHRDVFRHLVDVGWNWRGTRNKGRRRMRLWGGDWTGVVRCYFDFKTWRSHRTR